MREHFDNLERLAERLKIAAENEGGVPHGWVIDYSLHFLNLIELARIEYEKERE